ncbi:MAG TPA: wax ester/triacylglycerol synthase family O-acyltransferase [Marmoricola sp.]|nr:wax ester/triacylglycerol synthase family O-acyltransferase [Marmoricola sp.]
MDRLSSLDSAFLHLEAHDASLHIASLAIFAGPVPPQERVRAAIEAKLPQVPRYRQRLRPVPLDIGRPVWVDDPAFDLDAHLHRAALPAPGGTAELQDLMERVMSDPMDRHIPLWEDWVVEGLARRRWALITKVHHSMVDGIAGTDLLTTVLDDSPDPVRPVREEWVPAPAPGPVRLVGGALRDNVVDRARWAGSVGGAWQVVRHAPSAAARLYGTGRGLLGFSTDLRPTAGSSLVGPIGRARRYRWTSVPLEDVLAVRDRYGTTLNDVVLAAVTAAFRGLLLERAETPRKDAVRTLVPVSVRHADERGHLDNRVSTLLAELPVEVVDPVDQLTEVALRLRALKASHEASAGEVITEVADTLPPPAVAAFLHLAFRTPHRHLTTVTTNVPGPPYRLWLCGRRMLEHYPYVPIADRLRTGIAITSYDGRLFLGITADRETVPDVDTLVGGIDTGFAALVESARRRTS